MAQKQIRDLGPDDLGKHLVYSEANGDRSSGTLEFIQFHNSMPHSAYVQIGNASHTIEFDEVVEIADGEGPDPTAG